MKKYIDIISKIFFVFLIIGLILLIIKGINYKNEIKKHPGKTICKYVFCKQSAKTNRAIVKYYVDEKLYTNSAGTCPDQVEIDKFYFLNYSTIDPNKISVDFSKEVKDSVLISELKSKLEFNYWLNH